MEQLPRHKAAQLFNGGIYLRRVISGEAGREPVRRTHRDDYYAFVLTEAGTCRFLVDFKEHALSAGEALVIQPGQVHCFIAAEQAEGIVLMADESLVGDDEKRTLEEFALSASSFVPDERCREELRFLAAMLEHRMGQEHPAQSIIRHLAETFIGIAAEFIRRNCLRPSVPRRRQTEITLAFRSLLKKEAQAHRRPSYYAGRLNLSTVYLNEAVRSETGMSVGRHIRGEVVLQAKRLLAYTDASVKEIAARLGFDDCAYFSRLFAQEAGIPPAAFRQKYLD